MSAGLISRTDLFLRLVMAFFWAGGVIFAVSSEGTALEVGYLLGLLAVFALLNVVGVRPQTSPRIIHLILGFETAILIAGAVVFPEINILFVPISILAIMRLSIQRGMMWTGLLAVVNVGVQFYEAGFPDGVVDSLINAFVLFALAAFASSLLEANRARHETQRLVGELEVANEQLRQHAVQVEELAVADERHRISRDLHDTLGHRLTVSIVQLEGAERLIAAPAERASEMVNAVRQQLVDGLSEVRRTVAMLRTPVAADRSLPKLLRELASDFEKATQLPIRVTVPDNLPALSEAYRLALYRVAQEALTNVQRHARASEAALVMDLSAEALTLRVSDNGIGLPDGADQQGFGLRGMRERILQLGGSVELNSEDTKGATILVHLPSPAGQNP